VGNEVDLWGRVLAALREGLNEQTFEAWIAPIRLCGCGRDALRIGVPSRFFAEWLRAHYVELIRDQFAECAGLPRGSVRVDIEVMGGEGNGAAAALDAERVRTEAGLNPKYSFDSFVVGASNEFAHAACLHVAESPGSAYNPLFIYGGVGLGKTHLMQAIGAQVLRAKPGMRVVYASCEKFTNHLIHAIQNGTTAAFRERYRSVDALLIDDIHFLAKKESTQEEFFHTFNTLYDARKQIVISSDRPPKDIPTLEERLVSRFEWGLVTDIAPPDLETRIAILRKHSETEGVRVPDDVITLVATHIKSNIRELEGALLRVKAYATLVGRRVDRTLAAEVLKDVVGGVSRAPSIDVIQRVVAEDYAVRVFDLLSSKRSRSVTLPRQVAMFLAREQTSASLPEIGQAFGGRDHSTVIHAINKIEELERTDDSVAAKLKMLRAKLEN